MRWPFKFYSDEGYVLALIRNCAQPLPRFGQLEGLSVSIGVLEWLYSFTNGEVEEYLHCPVQPTSDNKYVPDQLSLDIFVYAGDHLSPEARLRLVSEAVGLERHVARGGMVAVSKLYHEWESYTHLTREIQVEGQEDPT